MMPSPLRPLSKRVGIASTLVSLIVILAQPDAQAVIAWLLSVAGVTRVAPYVPVLTKLVGGFTVLAALFSHSATGTGGTSTLPAPDAVQEAAK